MCLAAYLGTKGMWDTWSIFLNSGVAQQEEKRKRMVRAGVGSRGKGHGGKALLQIAASLGWLECST
jgi:hypothetical protein